MDESDAISIRKELRPDGWAVIVEGKYISHVKTGIPTEREATIAVSEITDFMNLTLGIAIRQL